MIYKVGQYLSRKWTPTIIACVVEINSRGGIRILRIGSSSAGALLSADWIHENYDIIGDEEDLRMYLMNRSLNE